MKKKRNNCKHSRSLKYMPVLFICLLTIPCNYSGLPVNQPSHNGDPVPLTLGEGNKSTKDVIVSGNFVLLSILLQIIITILLSLILGYLDSVSMVKHCLVFYLYRELLHAFLVQGWVWTITVITCLVNGNGISIDKFTAKIVSYCFYGTNLYLLLILNFLESLKFYIAKEKVLDPSLPWNEDDLTILRRFRLGSFLLANIFLVILFASKGYPKVYYDLIGDDRYLSELPTETSICAGLNILLIITYIITCMATKLSKSNQGEYVATRFPQQLHWLSKMFLSIAGVIILFGVFKNSLKGGNFWLAHFVVGVVLGLLLPTYIILTTAQMKTYLKNVIIRVKSETVIFLLQIGERVSNLNMFKSSNQIQPTV